jgi:Fuc2NAc and GlcNAc transferase
MLLDLAATLVAAVAAFAATTSVRRNARRLGVIQAPNERSSHTIPTPSGGGVGIVFGGTIACASAIAPSPWPLGLGLEIALAIAAIGFVDDRRPLPARYRLFAQLVLVAIALGVCVPLDALTAQVGLPLPAALVATLALIVAIYWINLFNFMDGIDGIAGSQAIFMCCAAALLAYLHLPSVTSEPPFWMLLGVAAATFGFLLLNWPPAKIFMGDAGSTYLGFMLVFLGLLTIAAGSVSLAQWAILAAAFAADATVTLARRLARRERVFEAHRRHAYQHLSRRWGSHRPVTLTFIAVNVIWLLPLAWLAGVPGWAWPAAIVAYLPLIGLAFYFGAGSPEQPARA